MAETMEFDPAAATGPNSWGVRWLKAALRRDITPLEEKIAEWSHRCFDGIYHLDGGNAWHWWLKNPDNYTHEISTITTLGSRGCGSSWGNLQRWCAVADELKLGFALRPVARHRTCIRFWHTEDRKR